MKKKILFFGELPSNIVHGISLSNELNLNILKNFFDVDIIEEKTTLKYHNKLSINKISNIIKYSYQIFKNNIKNRYDYFYLVFSLSLFGAIKTLFALVTFKLSGNGITVLHIHRGDFLKFYNRNIFNKLITKIIFKLVDKLIVLSQNQKKEMSLFFKGDIYVLENSLLNEYEALDRNIGSSRFLYISNYIKEKGIFDLLEAFKVLEKEKQDFILECYGKFVNNKEEILKYASDKIIINGFINEKEKFKKLQNFDCLILPSWNEGQPLIILEAISQGAIVLTTKVGLISEILGEDYPFYFEPNNVESLIGCVKKFMEYEKKYILSKKLYNLYKNNYSKIKHIEKLLKIFNR